MSVSFINSDKVLDIMTYAEHTGTFHQLIAKIYECVVQNNYADIEFYIVQCNKMYFDLGNKRTTIFLYTNINNQSIWLDKITDI
jgi:hypothetical protein